MESPEEITPAALLALCHQYMLYARSAQNIVFQEHNLEYKMRQKFLKNTLIFTMILSDYLQLMSVDNVCSEEIAEISEVALTLRKTLFDLCEIHRPRIQSFVFAVDNFILRLQSVSPFPTAGPKAAIKFMQLEQCVSVLESADYSALEVFTEKQEPTDEPMDDNEIILHRTLEQIFHNCPYDSVGEFSCSCAFKTLSFEARMMHSSYQKDKAELLWICQDYPVIFSQAYDESEIDDLVLRIPKWHTYCCCVVLVCMCIGGYKGNRNY